MRRLLLRVDVDRWWLSAEPKVVAPKRSERLTERMRWVDDANPGRRAVYNLIGWNTVQDSNAYEHVH